MKPPLHPIILPLIATAPLATAATVQIDVSEDFTVRRSTAAVEANIHPKQSAGANVDRYAMFTFQSPDFGADVTAVDFGITARDTTNVFAAGTWTFNLYGVTDGDPQDEVISEASYDPDGSGTASLYRNTETMIDLSQVTSFGTFTATTAATVSFSDPALLAFVQADTNDFVTLVITRVNASGDNTVFENASANLTLEVVPEPSSLALVALGGLFLARRRRHG